MAYGFEFDLFRRLHIKSRFLASLEKSENLATLGNDQFMPDS